MSSRSSSCSRRGVCSLASCRPQRGVRMGDTCSSLKRAKAPSMPFASGRSRHTSVRTLVDHAVLDSGVTETDHACETCMLV
jgi:hypothetical protein